MLEKEERFCPGFTPSLSSGYYGYGFYSVFLSKVRPRQDCNLNGGKQNDKFHLAIFLKGMPLMVNLEMHEL